MARFIRKRRSYGRGRARTRRVSRRAKPSRGFTRKVKRAVNTFAEKKAFNRQIVGTIAGSNGIFYFLNDQIMEGVGSADRIGNKIHARALRIKGFVEGPVDSDGRCTWRVIIGCWKDFQNSTPGYADILDDPSYIAQSLYQRDVLQAQKWVPMYDKLITTTATLGFSPDKSISFFDLQFAGKRLPMKDQQFNFGNKPNWGYFIWLANTATGGAPYPLYQFNMRMSYTDV